MILYAGAVLLGTFISAVAQVLLKKAALVERKSFLEEYLNIRTIVAYGVFFGATLLSVYAYKGIPLSMGPVLEATGYIYVTIFGVKFFGEKLNGGKILSLALIILGICVYSWGVE